MGQAEHSVRGHAVSVTVRGQRGRGTAPSYPSRVSLPGQNKSKEEGERKEQGERMAIKRREGGRGQGEGGKSRNPYL